MPCFVTALVCYNCKDMIYSRAQKDERECSCGSFAIRGGFEAPVIVEKKSHQRYELRTFEVKMSSKELIDDFKNRINEYGLTKNFQTLEDSIFGKK